MKKPSLYVGVLQSTPLNIVGIKVDSLQTTKELQKLKNNEISQDVTLYNTDNRISTTKNYN